MKGGRLVHYKGGGQNVDHTTPGMSAQSWSVPSKLSVHAIACTAHHYVN